MKKVILFTFTLLAACFSAKSQDTIMVIKPKPVPSDAPSNRINIYGAYAFDDKVNSSYDSYNYFDGTIKGGLQYGVGIEFMVKPTYGVELLWISQTTTAPMNYLTSSFYIPKTNTFDLNLNYAMLGFGRHMQKPGSKMEGYGGLMLGCLFANAKNPDNGTDVDGQKFAWGFRLGGNIWASDKVALKIQGQLLSAVQSVGGSLYFGTGGAGAGVSTYSSMLQWSVGGGLAFKMGR